MGLTGLPYFVWIPEAALVQADVARACLQRKWEHGESTEHRRWGSEIRGLSDTNAAVVCIRVPGNFKSLSGFGFPAWLPSGFPVIL